MRPVRCVRRTATGVRRSTTTASWVSALPSPCSQLNTEGACPWARCGKAARRLPPSLLLTEKHRARPLENIARCHSAPSLDAAARSRSMFCTRSSEVISRHRARSWCEIERGFFPRTRAAENLPHWCYPPSCRHPSFSCGRVKNHAGSAGNEGQRYTIRRCLGIMQQTVLAP